MDEKDLNENEEKLTDVNNDSVDSGLEEKDGVRRSRCRSISVPSRFISRAVRLFRWRRIRSTI